MNFLSTNELAEKWGVNPSLVLRLARERRIEGAILFGNKWLFPPDAQKPADGRTKSSRSATDNNSGFRFPIFLNFNENTFFPPLSEEEKQLRQAQIDFHACRFDMAKEILVPLEKKSENRYIRISALFHLCFIAIFCNSPDFKNTYNTFNEALTGDYPHKTEMIMFRYWFDSDFGSYKSILEEFFIDPEYTYHPSSYYLFLIASMLPIENGDMSILSKIRFDTYELLCQQMEHEGYYMEAQMLHLQLLGMFQLQGNQNKMHFHIRKALEIALKHKLYWNAAFSSHYFTTAFHKVLKDFPSDFSETIISTGNMLHKKLLEFESSGQSHSFLTVLSGKELEIAYLANQGYSNREVSHMMKLSEKTISKRYNAIYDKLGISSKKELSELINHTYTNHKKF